MNQDSEDSIIIITMSGASELMSSVHLENAAVLCYSSSFCSGAHWKHLLLSDCALVIIISLSAFPDIQSSCPHAQKHQCGRHWGLLVLVLKGMISVRRLKQSLFSKAAVYTSKAK